MVNGERFPYLVLKNRTGEVATRPLLPFVLTYGEQSRSVTGLLDTGADVNVLPYHVGINLGAIWSEQATAIVLSGNLARFEARGIILTANIGSFAPVRLAFAWTQNNDVPLILGQTNFFMAFDVCFYRSQQFFELHSG